MTSGPLRWILRRFLILPIPALNLLELYTCQNPTSRVNVNIKGHISHIIQIIPGLEGDLEEWQTQEVNVTRGEAEGDIAIPEALGVYMLRDAF